MYALPAAGEQHLQQCLGALDGRDAVRVFELRVGQLGRPRHDHLAP